MSIGARSAIVWLIISHSSYPHRDLADAPHLICCFLETSRASGHAACHGEAFLNYGLAIEPKDEPAGSSRTSPQLAAILRVLVQADDHLAPALHIQLAEQVVDMQLRCRQADVQPTGDLLVTEPRRDQLGGLPFAPGERGCRGSGGAARRPPGPSRVARHHEYP